MTRQLVNAGIPLEQIPQEWLDVILAGTLKWLTTSKDGVEEIINRLGFDIFQGDSRNEYVVTDQNESKATIVPPEDVLFFRGVTINGLPIHLKQLSISEKERSQCEDCGIISFCLQEIREQSGNLKNLCNCCVINHENARIRDLGERATCDRCTAVSCTHHPYRFYEHRV